MPISLKDRITSLQNQFTQPFPGIESDLQNRVNAQMAIVDPTVRADKALVMKVKYALGKLPEVDTAYSLYADNARSQGAKEFLNVDQFMSLEQVQPWLATIPQRRNFANKVVESYRRGGQHIDLHVAIAAAAQNGSEADIDRLVNIADKTDKLEELDPIESNMVTQFIYGLSGILPGIFKGVDAGLDEALLGAATGVAAAGIAGQLGPQIALPEEILTVPAGALGGAGIGLQFGMAEFWYREGKGANILEMRRKGVDHETANRVASIAAIPYAALELIQIKRITPGLKGPLRNVILAGTQKAMGRAVVRHGSILTREVRDEVIQEAILFSAADLGVQLSDQTEITFDQDYFIARSQRLWETAKQAAVSMALLPLPSVVYTAMTEKGITIKPEPTITLTPQQEIEYVEAQKREITADETIAEIDKEKLYDDLNAQIEQIEGNIKPIPVAEERQDVTVEAGTTVEGSPVSFGTVLEGDASVAPEIKPQAQVPTRESTITVEGQPITFSHTKPSADIFAKAHLIKDRADMPDADYREIAFKITGKTSMKDMTYQEGVRFLESLQDQTDVDLTFDPAKGSRTFDSSNKTLKPYGKLSRQINVLKELVTPQDITAEAIGLGPTLEQAQHGRRDLDHEFGTVSLSVDKVLDALNKESKISRRERRRSLKKGAPTAAEIRMIELLDKEETAPGHLNETETEIFNYFRTLSNDLLTRENQGRRQRGEKEIPFRKAYVRHIADASAKAIRTGHMEIPAELQPWLKTKINSKIYNPMEFQRKLASELEVLFSRDLRAVTKAMAWTALKEIHLTDPIAAVNEELDALGDLVSPANRAWVKTYIDVSIKGESSAFDKKVNAAFTEGGLGKALSVVLQPFGKVLSARPVSHFNAMMGRIQNVSALSFLRPKILVRNLTQPLQESAIYGWKFFRKGFNPGDEVTSKIINESKYFRGYTGIEQMPTGLISKFEKNLMMPFQWTAQHNAQRTMKVAIAWTMDIIKDPKNKDLGWADSKRDYTEPDGFWYPSELRIMAKEADVGAATVEYDYVGLALPGIFRHKTAGVVTKFQTWWMNHFFRFHREAGIRAFTGYTSYGLKLPKGAKWNYAKYFITGVPILRALGYTGSTLLNVAPTGLAPTATLMFALYAFATARDKREREKAARDVQKIMPLMIPGGLAAKDAEAVWNGDKDIDEFLFYKDPQHADAKDAWW